MLFAYDNRSILRDVMFTTKISSILKGGELNKEGKEKGLL